MDKYRIGASVNGYILTFLQLVETKLSRFDHHAFILLWASIAECRVEGAVYPSTKKLGNPNLADDRRSFL
jgi:hypothetical protein